MARIRPLAVEAARGAVSDLVVSILLLLATTSPAPAQTHHVGAGIEWRRDHPDCIDGPRLTLAVGRILGREAGRLRANVRVSGRVGGAPGAFRARIDVRAADGQLLGVRELASPSARCGDLDEPLAIVVAMLFEIEVPRATLRLPPRQAEVEMPRARLSAAAGGSIGVGFMPSPWLAPALRLALDAGSLRVELEGAWALPREVAVRGRAATLELSAVIVGAHVCLELARLDWLVPRACAAFRTAVLSASGSGFDADRDHLLIQPMAGGGLEAAFPLARRWTLDLRIEAAGHLVRRKLVYTSGDDRPTLHETGLASGAIGLFLRHSAPVP